MYVIMPSSQCLSAGTFIYCNSLLIRSKGVFYLGFFDSDNILVKIHVDGLCSFHYSSVKHNGVGL